MPTEQPQQRIADRATVALVQMTCEPTKEANIAKAIARIGEAAAAGADIVCLQELFAGPYFCQTEDFRWFDEAEPIPGPTSERLSAAAAGHHVVVVGSLFERRAPGLYHNAAVLFDRDGRQLGLYRKMHIPDDPGYYEKFYFTPGDLGFRSFNTLAGPVGTCVCWDQWYPEAARLTALAGARIIFYPTAIGWLPRDKEALGASQHAAWETMMRSHAIANGVFVAAVNRTGHEMPVDPAAGDGIEFWGASFICDPFGNVLGRASHDREETVLVECDFSQLDSVRTHWPFLRDRRIDAYGELTRRFLD